MISRSVLPLVLGLSLLAIASGQEKKVNLMPKWQVGKKYVLSQDMVTVTQLPMPNAGGEQEMTMKMDMEISVTQPDPGEKRVAMAFTGMKMTMDMAGQKMEIDAANPEQAAMFGDVLKIAPVFFYDNEDQFVRMEGLEAQAAGPMAKMADPEMLKQIVNGSMETMPQEPVAIGHQWEQEVAMPVEGADGMAVKATYRFERMEMVDGIECAVVTFDGKLTGDMATEGVQMSFEKADFSGAMYVDPEIGYARKTEATTDMVMKMTLPGQAEPMSLPMKQRQTVKLTALEDL